MIPLGMMNSSQESLPEEVPQQRAWVYRLNSTCLISRVTGQVPLPDFTSPVRALLSAYARTVVMCRRAVVSNSSGENN